MLTPVTILLILLGLVAIAFVVVWGASLTRRRQWQWPGSTFQVIGFVTNFFDTLGIGSYATTTAAYRLKQLITDEMLPGTLNIGHCIPIVLQAFIYMSIVKVNGWTLTLMIAAAVLGAWLGAGWVVRLSRRTIQMCLGIALLLAAALLLAKLLNYLPAGGNTLSLHGTWLMVAIACNFVFGALMMIGVGAYAPIMIMVSLLGMNPTTAFPIMMGSCAFLAPVGGAQFLKKEKYNAPAALGLTLGGIPAVLIAAFLVRELPLDFVRWLVLFIAVYTAIGLLRSAFQMRLIHKKCDVDRVEVIQQV